MVNGNGNGDTRGEWWKSLLQGFLVIAFTAWAYQVKDLKDSVNDATKVILDDLTTMRAEDAAMRTRIVVLETNLAVLREQIRLHRHRGRDGHRGDSVRQSGEDELYEPEL